MSPNPSDRNMMMMLMLCGSNNDDDPKKENQGKEQKKNNKEQISKKLGIKNRNSKTTSYAVGPVRWVGGEGRWSEGKGAAYQKESWEGEGTHEGGIFVVGCSSSVVEKLFLVSFLSHKFS